MLLCASDIPVISLKHGPMRTDMTVEDTLADACGAQGFPGVHPHCIFPTFKGLLPVAKQELLV